MADASFPKLSSMHFYGWKKGLKTGMYYLRTRPAVDAIAFTVNKDAIAKENAAEQAAKDEELKMATLMCSLENKDDCMMCGS